jgi:hypothetical protein
MQQKKTTGFTATILTLNPHGTRGVLIGRDHYDCMREFIISSFEDTAEISFNELIQRMSELNFNLPTETALWYLIKVKQDLQARGILKVSFVGAPPRIQILKLNRKALKRPVIPY